MATTLYPVSNNARALVAASGDLNNTTSPIIVSLESGKGVLFPVGTFPVAISSATDPTDDATREQAMATRTSGDTLQLVRADAKAHEGQPYIIRSWTAADVQQRDSALNGVESALAGLTATDVAVNAAGFSGLLSSADTTVQAALATLDATSALSNPMTTAGDMILGGTSGTPGRLGIGTNGQVLTSNGTTAAWATPSGGSGSGGLTLIQQVSLTSTASSVTFSDIPGTYKSLFLDVQAKTNSTSVSTPGIRGVMNGDTGSNYDSQYNYTLNTSRTNNVELGSNNATFLIISGSVSGTPSGNHGCGEVWFRNYANTTTWYRTVYGRSFAMCNDTAADVITTETFCKWRSTSAITSITLTPTNGDFISGCVFTLYGVS